MCVGGTCKNHGQIMKRGLEIRHKEMLESKGKGGKNNAMIWLEEENVCMNVSSLVVLFKLPNPLCILFFCSSFSKCKVHGGAGVCQDTPLAHMYVSARSLQIADGPDEVICNIF